MDAPATPPRIQRFGLSALAFAAIGLLLYALLYFAAEQLVHRTGRSNPFFKIAQAREPSVDWVILGASHAMPLDFGDFNAQVQRQTGLKILNLASPGTGPLYNRFVLENYLRGHGARNVMYVVDSFAFSSRAWNEDRFADAKLLARTPLAPAIASDLWRYVRDEGVPPRALLDYASGFSKVNNRDRFKPDAWEGEAQFDRVYRPSASAVKKRIDYLYPGPVGEAVLERYLGEFDSLLSTARRAGANVVVVKLPTPPGYRSRLPGEAGFDTALAALLTRQGVAYHDYSAALDEPRYYFDTDHLNRAGLAELLERHLKSLLLAGATRPAAD